MKIARAPPLSSAPRPEPTSLGGRRAELYVEVGIPHIRLDSRPIQTTTFEMESGTLSTATRLPQRQGARSRHALTKDQYNWSPLAHHLNDNPRFIGLDHLQPVCASQTA